MKILLVAINAKYSHTNLAVRLLKAYAERHSTPVREGLVRVEIAEWNINQPSGTIVRGIFASAPDVVLFSTYIWNRAVSFKVARDVRLVLPDAVIGFGGPEVSWTVERTFLEVAACDVVFAGEGEATFAAFADRVHAVNATGGVAIPKDWRVSRDESPFAGIPGLYYRMPGEGLSNEPVATAIGFGGPRALIENLDDIPFAYSEGMVELIREPKITYYESSRGCPFTCAYCLSALDTRVRYYPLSRVLGEIGRFLEAGVPLVKFVDRTFNLDPARFLAIWEFIRDHHNGKTLFHFEIAAEFLPDEAFALLETMPPGAVQFEIGIQSASPETLALVGRNARVDELAARVRRIPRHVHTHVDLIAGLPGEDLAGFARSFDFAFSLGADVLQLGFLKVLPGSPMERMALDDPGYRWSSDPPYEVVTSPSLGFADLVVLKGIESLVDSWFNSGLMRNALARLVSSGDGAFSRFRELASFAVEYFPDHDLFLPRKPGDCFACVAAFLSSRGDAIALETLRFDFLLQGKPGSFPAWFSRRYSKEAHDAALEVTGFLRRPGGYPLSRREAYSRTEYERYIFGQDTKETAVLFQYGESGSRGAGVMCAFMDEDGTVTNPSRSAPRKGFREWVSA